MSAQHALPNYTTGTLVVVMPAYNAAPYIREAIGSMQAQTFGDFDLLIIDDRSSDDTCAIIESYDDPRIHLVRRTENGGVVDTLNTGLELVRHNFIARMDADDRSLPERFQKQVDFLQTHPEVDLLGTHLTTFGVKARDWKYPLEHERIKAAYFFGNSFPHAPLMARSEVFKEARYSKRVMHMEDHELWLRLLPKHRFAILPDVLYEYRRHEEGVTVAHDNTRRERLRKLLRIPWEWLGLEPTERELMMLSGDKVGLGGYAAHVKEYRHMIDRILQANNSKQVLDHDVLTEFLEGRWDRLFYLMQPAGILAAVNYWKTSGKVKGGQVRYLLGGMKRSRA